MRWEIPRWTALRWTSVHAPIGAVLLTVALTAGPLTAEPGGLPESVSVLGSAGVLGPVAVSYTSPVPPPLTVLRPFVAPVTRYGSGHRGVDLRVAGSPPLVRAAGPGTVTFAGRVAGRGLLVIAHPDGIRTEYEPVTPLVGAGDTVRGGAVIGRLDGTDAACGVPRCLHWGARRGDVYLDPLTLLRPLGPVRLLPWHGPAP